MTPNDRLDALQALGFTPRQAGFLAMTLLAGGVCMRRQYCTFAGIARGQKSHDFFTRLLIGRFAVALSVGRHQTQLYHLRHKRLYTAVGEPDSRYRRSADLSLPRLIERLMTLDALIARRDWRWLLTEREKTAYFTQEHQLLPTAFPQRTFRSGHGSTVRYFPHKCPIGLPPEGRRVVLAYLVTKSQATDFRFFLEAHSELLRRVPAWTLLLVVPSHRQTSVGPHRAAVDDHLAAPLRPAVLDELRWYFEARRAGLTTRTARFTAASHAFGTQRFQVLYRLWCRDGDAVLTAARSPVLRDAITGRRGRVEVHRADQPYNYLASLVGTA